MPPAPGYGPSLSCLRGRLGAGPFGLAVNRDASRGDSRRGERPFPVARERPNLQDEATALPKRPRGSPVSSFSSRLFKFPEPPGRSHSSTRKVAANRSNQDDDTKTREPETANARHNGTARGARGAAMSQTQLLPSVMTVRSRCMVPDALPILIEVPRIETVGRKTRVRSNQPAHPAEWQRGMRGRRPRRRLRRHVRLSACTLLAMTPFAFAACFAWSGRPGPATPPPGSASRNDGPQRVCLVDPGREDGFVDGRRTASIDHRPVTLLSIEAASPATGPEAEQQPVILPGYLLPDNSREEPVHEGS